MLPVVFTMGKVGSTSVRNALLRSGLVCFDVHSLKHTNPAANAQAWHQHARSLRDCGIMNADNVAFITLVREPVGRNLSGYFQNLKKWHPADMPTVEQAIEGFLRDYHHPLPGQWFQKQFKPFARFNVYEHAFDPETGYAVHRREGQPDVIVMRAELPDQAKADVLSEYYGREVEITRDNTASAKDYSDLYRQAREPGRLPRAYVDEMYDTEYARHFWTGEEIEALRSQWTG